jgi:hypothetical protein
MAGGSDRPPKGFHSRPLDLTEIAVGSSWFRLYQSRFPDPLGFGYRPSRFSDPRTHLPEKERFAAVYLGSSVKVCFLEAILRDQGNGRLGDWPVEYAELESWTCATVNVAQPLRLVDLRGDGAIRMGIPSDVAHGTDHETSQAWSAAIWIHDLQPDGVIYSSRLNADTNIAVYDRALGKVAAGTTGRLIDCRKELAVLLRDLAVAIVKAN